LQIRRHFALRVVPDLAFIGGLPARIVAARAQAERGDEDEVPLLPLVLATLQAIIREGCDSPEALSTRLSLTRDVSRVKAREIHETYIPFVPEGKANESFEATRDRMRTAALIKQFTEGGH
jgi:hypothetical protein